MCGVLHATIAITVFVFCHWQYAAYIHITCIYYIILRFIYLSHSSIGYNERNPIGSAVVVEVEDDGLAPATYTYILTVAKPSMKCPATTTERSEASCPPLIFWWRHRKQCTIKLVSHVICRLHLRRTILTLFFLVFCCDNHHSIYRKLFTTQNLFKLKQSLLLQLSSKLKKRISGYWSWSLQQNTVIEDEKFQWAVKQFCLAMTSWQSQHHGKSEVNCFKSNVSY